MRILFAICFFCSFAPAYADSPLTSTFFAPAYADEPLIAEILKLRDEQSVFRHTLRADHLALFDDQSKGLDLKIALVNGLGWDVNDNVAIFIAHLSKKYNAPEYDIFSLLVSPEGMDFPAVPASLSDVHYHDFVLLSYMQAMHDYFQPQNALIPLTFAMNEVGDSYATMWVFSLIYAQIYMDYNWCDVYQVCLSTRVMRQQFSSDTMRPEAVDMIMNYIGLYADACSPEEEEFAEEATEEVELPFPDMTLEFYQKNPVYVKPAKRQESSKSQHVNLVLQNNNEPPFIYTWIEYNEEIDGTAMEVYVRNNGNTTSIETNLAILFDADPSIGLPEMHFQEKIPPIQGGKQTMVLVKIPFFWVYTPVASFRIVLDFDDVIQETDEKDNEKHFYEKI